jgi:hypothetical protein
MLIWTIYLFLPARVRGKSCTPFRRGQSDGVCLLHVAPIRRIERSVHHPHWSENREAGEWAVAQMLIVVERLNDWEVQFVVSLLRSRAENRAVVRFVTGQPVGAS